MAGQQRLGEEMTIPPFSSNRKRNLMPARTHTLPVRTSKRMAPRLHQSAAGVGSSRPLSSREGRMKGEYWAINFGSELHSLGRPPCRALILWLSRTHLEPHTASLPAQSSPVTLQSPTFRSMSVQLVLRERVWWVVYSEQLYCHG